LGMCDSLFGHSCPNIVQVLVCGVHAKLWVALLLLIHHALLASGLAACVVEVFCLLMIIIPSVPPLVFGLMGSCQLVRPVLAVACSQAVTRAVASCG
jgi:hypothetical protein